MKQIIERWRQEILLEQKKSLSVEQQIRNYVAANGRNISPNINANFAVLIAKRESNLNPNAVIGTRKGLFQIGLEAAKDINELPAYTKTPFSINDNTRMGLKYLQYQYDFVANNMATDKRFSKYDIDTMVYIAFNLGRQNMIKLLKALNAKIADQGVISSIISQTPEFKGKNDLETINKYYNTIKNTLTRGLT